MKKEMSDGHTFDAREIRNVGLQAFERGGGGGGRADFAEGGGIASDDQQDQSIGEMIEFIKQHCEANGLKIPPIQVIKATGVLKK